MIDHTERTTDQLRHRALAGNTRLRILEQLAGRSRPTSIAELARQLALHPNTVRMQLGQLVEAGLVLESREETGGRGRPRLVFSAVTTALDSGSAQNATGGPAADADPARPNSAGSPSSPGSASGEDTRYRLLAEVLVERLERMGDDPRDRAVETGRDWGRQLAEQSTGELVEILDDLGFAPGPIGPTSTTPAPTSPSSTSPNSTNPGPVASGKPGPAGAQRELALHHCPFGEVARAHPAVVCNIHLGLMQGVLASRGGRLRARSVRPFVKPDLCLTQLDAAPTDGPTVQPAAAPQPATPQVNPSPADRA